jgi:hypothetical protein
LRGKRAATRVRGSVVLSDTPGVSACDLNGQVCARRAVTNELQIEHIRQRSAVLPRARATFEMPFLTPSADNARTRGGDRMKPRPIWVGLCGRAGTGHGARCPQRSKSLRIRMSLCAVSEKKYLRQNAGPV